MWRGSPHLMHPQSSPSRGNFPLLALLLLLAATIAYLPAINGGFIWDDNELLIKNPQIHHVAGLVEIWQGKNCADYIPLTLTSFWLEWRIWGQSCPGYHLTK